MSNEQIINIASVLYYDEEYFVIPFKNITANERMEMIRYLKELGDDSFIVDEEIYVSTSGLFNLTLKFCDKYIFI